MEADHVTLGQLIAVVASADAAVLGVFLLASLNVGRRLGELETKIETMWTTYIERRRN